MNERAKRILEWSKKKKAGPYLIEIWPTNRCNLRCIMCGTWNNREKLEKMGIKYDPKSEIKMEVSEERLLKLVDEANELNAKEFLITGGGEPFVRKSTTLKLIKKIKECGMFGNINTNGSLLTKKDIDEIVKTGWDMIMFSVDGPDAKTHDFIRGVRGTFQKVKTALQEIKKLKKRYRQDKPKVVFNTVLTNKIFDKIDKLIMFASEMGVSDITFIPLIVYSEKMKSIELNKKQKMKIKAKIQELIKLSEKLDVNTNLPWLEFFKTDQMNEVILNEIKNSPRDIIHSPCYEPFLHLLIKGNGETTFCCMIENSPENIKEKSLKKIWFGKYFSLQRRNFINKKIREECKFCVFSQYSKNKEIRDLINLEMQDTKRTLTNSI